DAVGEIAFFDVLSALIKLVHGAGDAAAELHSGKQRDQLDHQEQHGDADEQPKNELGPIEFLKYRTEHGRDTGIDYEDRLAVLVRRFPAVDRNRIVPADFEIEGIPGRGNPRLLWRPHQRNEVYVAEALDETGEQIVGDRRQQRHLFLVAGMSPGVEAILA